MWSGTHGTPLGPERPAGQTNWSHRATPANPFMRLLALVLALLSPLAVVGTAAGAFWGPHGHEMSARAAVMALPPGMPAFFAGATEQLTYLNPEPDRWRHEDFREMDQAYSYDHYVDLENVPEAARTAPDRYRYLEVLYRETTLPRPERDAGLLPFHILELYQRLVTEWALWHEAERAEDLVARGFIQDRILNDAGILGHYVTDASQPHHTTIHFNGWNASGALHEPNPEGFTESRDFHWRFESDFVRAHVRPEAVVLATRAWPDPPRWEGMDAVREAVWTHLEESHDQVRPLYTLERDHGFTPAAGADPATVAFTVGRLSHGARMLRDLWWNAWLEGRSLAQSRRGPGGV